MWKICADNCVNENIAFDFLEYFSSQYKNSDNKNIFLVHTEASDWEKNYYNIETYVSYYCNE